MVFEEVFIFSPFPGHSKAIFAPVKLGAVSHSVFHSFLISGFQAVFHSVQARQDFEGMTRLVGIRVSFCNREFFDIVDVDGSFFGIELRNFIFSTGMVFLSVSSYLTEP